MIVIEKHKIEDGTITAQKKAPILRWDGEHVWVPHFRGGNVPRHKRHLRVVHTDEEFNGAYGWLCSHGDLHLLENKFLTNWHSSLKRAFSHLEDCEVKDLSDYHVVLKMPNDILTKAALAILDKLELPCGTHETEAYIYITLGWPDEETSS